MQLESRPARRQDDQIILDPLGQNQHVVGMPPTTKIAPIPAPEVSCENCHQPIGSESPLFCKNCGRQWHQYCFLSAKLCPKCTTPLATKAAHDESKAKLEVSMTRLTKRVSQFLLFANGLTLPTWGVSQYFATLAKAGPVTGLPGGATTEWGLLLASVLCSLVYLKSSYGKVALLGVGLALVAYVNTAIGFGLDTTELPRVLSILKLAFYVSPVACIITALYALNDWRQVSAALQKKRV